ncbi:MAG TPA: GNAT family N-acetyltransferase [Dehalococcoidia bacterium]|nr:GNAT family N-acetyltransferase [Dehalococcoidia bacterium]
MLEHDGLIARACESIAGYLALGNETFEAHGALFVRNHATPTRYDANHIDLVRASDPAEIEALLRRLDMEYEGFGHRRIHTDPLTPPQLAARLTLEPGYTTNEELFLILEGRLQATPRPSDIREIVSDADWSTYAGLIRADTVENDEKHGRTSDFGNFGDHLSYLRAKAPAVRAWMAYVDGVAAGYFSSWPGENGVGQVEDLFVLPQYRHRGIATALIAHCVDDAQARGAEAVVIGADPFDTPKHMYAALGFRPSFMARSYLRLVRPEAAS